MLRFHELRQNPAAVTFYDEAGARVTVSAERLRQGLVNMTCQCRHHSEAGWCMHCLAVLCDRVILEDDQNRLAFESIVAGTRLRATAHKLKNILESFATAYQRIKRNVPAALDPDQLDNFATSAYHASITGGQLALAIKAFIKELRPTAKVKWRAGPNVSASHRLFPSHPQKVVQVRVFDCREPPVGHQVDR
jgi:hypothetical protein